MSTPPTVHDSDRKAAEEINSYEILCARHNLRCDLNENALIIARHHAEERAAAAHAEKALKDAALMCCEDYDERDPFGEIHRVLTEALTALRNASARTASQSPTEGKT